VLLEFDRNRLPLRVLSIAVVVVVLGGTIWPEVRPEQTFKIGGFSGPEATALLAILFASLSWPAMFAGDRWGDFRDALTRVAGLIVVALLLGPYALLVITILCSIVYLITSLAARFWPLAERIGWAAALLIATLSWMIAIGSDRTAPHWVRALMAEHGAGRTVLVAGIAIAVLSVASYWIRSRSRGVARS
jgi:hypothetical protein